MRGGPASLTGIDERVRNEPEGFIAVLVATADAVRYALVRRGSAGNRVLTAAGLGDRI